MFSSSRPSHAPIGRMWLRLLVPLVILAAALAAMAPAAVSAAQPDPGTPGVEQLSLGHDHACALATNGHAWCWGSGEPQDYSPPAEDTFRQISASGNLHSCGVLTDGSVNCWGYDGDDQSSPPTDLFTQVTTGGRHSCGVRTDGTLACWGGNDKGQSAPPAGTFLSVSAGDAHACAVAADRSVACWGADGAAQATGPTMGSFLAVSAGYSHACGLQADGTAVCWGADDEGQTDAPTDTLTSVSAGYSHSCGLSQTGRAVCWGNDSYGESTPPADTFTEVTAGYLTTCGILANGTLKCWGYETYESALSAPPGPVGHWTIASGARHSCAVSSDSSLICWGADDAGQSASPQGTFHMVTIGDDTSCALATAGTVSCWGAPIAGTPPSVALRQVAVSDSHACGIAVDGRLACWGANDAGQATPPAGAFSAVSVGRTSSCAIAGDGSLACWGASDQGQTTPPAGAFRALSAGDATSCAIAMDGSLACWGANDAGQATAPAGQFVSVGVGGTYACAVAASGVPGCWGDTSAPRGVPTPNIILSQIAVGGDHTCGIASNGILVCWGADDVGQSDPPVPGAPVLTAPIPAQTATEDQLFSLDVPAATFTDTEPLTWTAALADGTDLPAWLLFDAQGLTLAGTPGDADVGTLTVAVIATDPSGLTGRTTFELTVSNSNDPPQAVTPIPDQDATEDTTWTFAIPDTAFMDDDLDSGDQLTLSMSSGDGSALPAWLRFDPATNTVTGTPSRDDIGQLSLLVTATDDGGLSIQTGLNLRIARINHAPNVNKAISEQKAIQDQAFTFTFAKDTFKDKDDGDTLAYDAAQKDGSPLPSWLAFARSDRTFSGSPRDSDVGTLVITVTAMDKVGATATTDFALKVINVDDPPALVSRIPDQKLDQDTPLQFTLSEDAFTDADLDTGDTITLRATGPDGGALPLWLTFDPATGTFSGTPRDADTGSLLVTVTATDSAGLDASGDFTITVNDVNDVPLVSQPTPDQQATVNQSFSLVLTADMFTDADADHGDSVTISATLEDGSPLPAWLTFDVTTLAFAGTPASGDTGQLSVSVVATDAQGAMGVDTFILDVVPERDQPTAPVVVIRRVPVSPTGSIATIVTWSAGKEAAQGSRVRYTIQIRQSVKGKWGKYKPFAIAGGRTGLNKNMKPGTYQLRLRAAVGRQAGDWIEAAPFALRLVQESDASVDFSGPWDKTSAALSSGKTARRTIRPGSSATVTITGDTVGLVMTSGKGSGIVEACVDPAAATPGSCRTIDMGQGRKTPRNVVTIFRVLGGGEHTVVVTVRQGPVEFDGYILQSTLTVAPAATSTP